MSLFFYYNNFFMKKLLNQGPWCNTDQIKRTRKSFNKIWPNFQIETVRLYPKVEQKFSVNVEFGSVIHELKLSLLPLQPSEHEIHDPEVYAAFSQYLLAFLVARCVKLTVTTRKSTTFQLSLGNLCCSLKRDFFCGFWVVEKTQFNEVQIMLCIWQTSSKPI